MACQGTVAVAGRAVGPDANERDFVICLITAQYQLREEFVEFPLDESLGSVEVLRAVLHPHLSHAGIGQLLFILLIMPVSAGLFFLLIILYQKPFVKKKHFQGQIVAGNAFFFIFIFFTYIGV